MGEVLELDAFRVGRQRRAEAAAEQAAHHPALRWVTPGGPIAHRRGVGGSTACGTPGDLALAPSGTRLCPDCYAKVALR